MRCVAPALLVLSMGCGSSWQIRKDVVLEVGCAEKAFYPDADGDGWGDAASEPVASCNPPEGGGVTASNGRDCDDTKKSITGRVGAMCPEGLVASDEPIAFEGVVYASSEFVFLYGEETPALRFTSATTACQDWSGADLADGLWVPRGDLATFDSQAELAEVQDAIEGALESGEVYAGFVGIGWEGDLQSGAWSWTDDASDAVIDILPWCAGEPLPEDFFPNLNPADPEHAPGLEDELENVRVALVLEESGSWCLGMPLDAVPAAVRDELEAGSADLTDPYYAGMAALTYTDGHLVCERQTPDPANYQEIVTAPEADE